MNSFIAVLTVAAGCCVFLAFGAHRAPAHDHAPVFAAAIVCEGCR